jgi:hypothetical protein
MPQRKDLGVIDVTWGSDRLCIKTVKDSRRQLPDTRPGVGYCSICSKSLEALSIRVSLISRMKFILGWKNVNTQQKKVQIEILHRRCQFLNRQQHNFSLSISESTTTFMLLIFKLAAA